MKKTINLLFDFYQKFFSGLLIFFFGNGCRFYPTCSEYTKNAVNKYGVIRGLSLGLRRIFRCHPLGGSGWDPVPDL